MAQRARRRTTHVMPLAISGYSENRLKSNHIEPHWCINHGPTTSLYYHDPDGNQIELQVDNFTTIEQANAFIGSSVFQENPIGVEFNPERLLERYENGDPIEALIAQGAA
jgi:hypothetical protein